MFYDIRLITKERTVWRSFKKHTIRCAFCFGFEEIRKGQERSESKPVF